MASSSRSRSRTAPAALPALRDTLVTVIAAVSASPALATKLAPQAITGTSSALVIIATPVQAVFSPV